MYLYTGLILDSMFYCSFQLDQDAVLDVWKVRNPSDMAPAGARHQEELWRPGARRLGSIEDIYGQASLHQRTSWPFWYSRACEFMNWSNFFFRLRFVPINNWLQLHSIVKPDCTRFGLIRASLSSKERTWHGYELISYSTELLVWGLFIISSENRYLLFLTENYAALDILKHYLSGVDSSQTLNTADVKQETMEPFVLFGSSFPKDKEYTQVCMHGNGCEII